MGKVKQFFLNLSLRKSIIIYIVVFSGIAISLSAITSSYCFKVSRNIYSDYPKKGEKYYLTNSKGERLGDGTIISKENTTELSQRDKRKVYILDVVSTVSMPFYSGSCLIIAVFLFYKNKLKKPLNLLEIASKKISNKDLNFKIHYTSQDELGKLCESFEKMREVLFKNNKEMWRQMEERKRLNAAFSHDLRTPLTVLKGYTEILKCDYKNISIENTAATMEKHIDRLERYAKSMSNLQRIEDIRANYEKIDLLKFIDSLEQIAIVITKKNKKKVYFKNNIISKNVLIDTEIVAKVLENLISNASYYAKSKVEIGVSEINEKIQIEVLDDGEGFSLEAREKALEPYFTEDGDKGVHFGLGLYICKLFCAHHGGKLEIENTEKGALVRASFKKSKL